VEAAANDHRRFVACWVIQNRMYCCEHEHSTLSDVMSCLRQHPSSFIRVLEYGETRSLNDREWKQYVGLLSQM
jgi:ribulose bisphosphate carboxylase small subunit